MAKKSVLILCFVLIVLCLASCGIKKGNDKPTSSPYVDITTKATKVYNTFKERLPQFKFKKSMNTSYNEGYSYAFSGECSKKEFEKYVKAVKGSGFTNEAAESKTYYTAKSADNYFVEIAYRDGGISVYISRF